jgi:hypothetical protein
MLNDLQYLIDTFEAGNFEVFFNHAQFIVDELNELLSALRIKSTVEGFSYNNLTYVLCVLYSHNFFYVYVVSLLVCNNNILSYSANDLSGEVLANCHDFVAAYSSVAKQIHQEVNRKHKEEWVYLKKAHYPFTYVFKGSSA